MVHIVIVEDNTDIARLYESLLTQHDIYLAATVQDTLNLLDTCTAAPDLVILDFHLPDESGLTVLDYIRAEPGMCNTQVWGISADDMLRDEANLKGLDRFFRKPLDIPQLMNAFQELFEHNAVAA